MMEVSGQNTFLRQRLRSWLAQTDLFLLCFLLLFMVDSVVLKPIALAGALLFLWRQIPLLKFRSAPMFYLLIPGMELLRFLVLNRDFSAGHTIAWAIGTCYWLMAYAAFLLVRHRAEEGGSEKISGTLTTWFFVNAAYSLCQLILTMVRAQSINPYALGDLAYGNSTGDYIKGVLLAPCYINMFINSFFAVWFLFRQKWGKAVLATLICCLTTTNFANIIFLPVLLLLLFVLKKKEARLTILACVSLFVVFAFFVSSGNMAYLRQSVSNTSGRPATPVIVDTATSHPPAEAPAISQEDENENDAGEEESTATIYARLAHPNGKVLSWKETWSYATSSPAHALIGAGMGNFSSLLALHMAHIHGRKHSRFYDILPPYVHPAYRANHYQIMKDVYALPEGYHSARHMPHSFPNQLVGEYGLLGVLVFLFGYVSYFLKRGGGRGYFLFLMLLAGAYLWFDYLFEYLSVMVIFELFFWEHLAAAKKVGEHG